MPLFTTKHDIQRLSVIALLRGLDSTLSDLIGRVSTYVDQSPEDIGRHLGEIIANEINHLQRTILTQEGQLEAQAKNMCRLMEQNNATPNAATLRELVHAKEEIDDLWQQLDKAQGEIKSLKEKSVLANAQYARQVECLQEMLAEYKRLNARQHLEMVDLMGDAYNQSQPPDETPG